MTKRLETAARQQGRLEAKRPSLKLPDECYQNVPHAPLVRDKEKVIILDEERVQLNRSNASKRRCVGIANDLVEATR